MVAERPSVPLTHEFKTSAEYASAANELMHKDKMRNYSQMGEINKKNDGFFDSYEHFRDNVEDTKDNLVRILETHFSEEPNSEKDS